MHDMRDGASVALNIRRELAGGNSNMTRKGGMKSSESKPRHKDKARRQGIKQKPNSSKWILPQIWKKNHLKIQKNMYDMV
jgi:hypothetical protein